jgi:hypothetical protein
VRIERLNLNLDAFYILLAYFSLACDKGHIKNNHGRKIAKRALGNLI